MENNKMKLLYFKVKLKGFINRIRGIRDLDNDGKIESIQEEIKGVFQQFVQMRESVEVANVKLNDVIEDELVRQKSDQEMMERIIKETNAKLETSLSRVDKVKKEIESNNRIKDKVSEFIVD